MTDRNELRRLAEAAMTKSTMTGFVPDCAIRDFNAAASPEVVLGLLDSISVLEGWYATASGQRNTAEAERDQLRAVAVWLRKALRKVAAGRSGDTTICSGEMSELARNVLADPDVEKL